MVEDPERCTGGLAVVTSVTFDQERLAIFRADEPVRRRLQLHDAHASEMIIATVQYALQQVVYQR